MSVLKDFMRKHMKSEDVVICSDLNEYIWKCGSRNPPGKVSVVALRTDINGTEKTIVSLSDSSIEKHLEIYTQSKPKVATPDESKDKGKIEDANVKEVDSKDEKNKSGEKQIEEADLEDKISESKDEPQSEDEKEMNEEKNEEENKNDDEKPQEVNQKESESNEKEESKEVKEG